MKQIFDNAMVAHVWAQQTQESGQIASSTEGARRICRANNLEDFGSETGRGPRGAAWEFESC